jgi:hypothetical protein
MYRITDGRTDGERSEEVAGTKLAELPVTVESPEASELQLQMDGNGNAMKDKAKAAVHACSEFVILRIMTLDSDTRITPHSNRAKQLKSKKLYSNSGLNLVSILYYSGS